MFGLVLAESRKHRGNVSSIRRAHPRAPLSPESIRVGASEDRARARHSTPARDCACVRTCDRPTQSRRHLSDANVSAGIVFGYLRFASGRRINGERPFGHAAFRLRATPWTSSPGGRTAGRGRGRARASSRSSAAAIRGCPASGRLWRGPGIAAGLVGRKHPPRQEAERARGPHYRSHGRGNIEVAGRNNRACAVALGRDVIRSAGSTRPRGRTASLHYSVGAVRVTQWARHRRGGHSGRSSAMVRTMPSNLRTGARSSAERRATSPLG